MSDMGLEFSDYLRYVGALIFVLALIWLGALGLRRALGRQAVRRSSKGGRLFVNEIQPIDARNKLVVVEYRDRAHVLLVGQESSLVVTTHNNNDTLAEEEQQDSPEPSASSLRIPVGEGNEMRAAQERPRWARIK